jgi:hypothetical protein
MSNLKDMTLTAHGGLDRWSRLSTATARITTGGVLWALKGQVGVIDESTVTVELHRQFTSHTPFGAPGWRDAYTPERVEILDESGEVVEERDEPRAAFSGHELETPWDRLHLAYFSGYAMWTYLTEPFSWALPGVETEELGPWEEDGERWTRLRVVFPSTVATHSGVNVYYLDDGFRIRRHDYTAEVLGLDAPVAHYCTEHQEFQGILAPTRRRVHLLDDEGYPMPEPLIVTIDLHEIEFA